MFDISLGNFFVGTVDELCMKSLRPEDEIKSSSWSDEPMNNSSLKPKNKPGTETLLISTLDPFKLLPELNL
ncbi:hypothetical protein BpHYR1_012942 [Brachionus plicatilis]|uniref:Uncharacterized protein n=1 Tax=Brachionus plicatilis TaxID=10195 RepID=A0A3M7SPK9_BRAPC|nr:hypothetical protein BpHYR1_012942 [Brachionus plicatilis]